MNTCQGITHLSVEPEMMRVASCTIPVQVALVVETETARAVEGCGCQEAGSVNLSLETKRSTQRQYGVK